MRKYLIALFILLLPLWLYAYVDTKDGVAITSNTDQDGATSEFASVSGIVIVDGELDDYPGERTNRVAVWQLEDAPGFLVDSNGSNTLTNNGVDENNAIYKQGAQSATFVYANTDDFTIADADLDAGFPFRYADGGSVIEKFSVNFWIYWAAGDLPSDNAEHQYLFCKYDATGDLRVFAVYVGSDDKLRMIAGHTSGTAEEFSSVFGAVFTHSVWYHVGVTYDNSTKGYVARIWDDNAGALLAVNDTHTFTNAIDNRDVPLTIGSRASGARYADCILDEIIVYNDVLSDAEIDAIRTLNQSDPGGGGTTYYVDTSGSDSNNGTTTGTPWAHCPGMQGWTGSVSLASGDDVQFNNANTWAASGGIAFMTTTGGVTYDGSTWGVGTRATFQATGTYSVALVHIDDDDAGNDTVVKGFELDGNEQSIRYLACVNYFTYKNLIGATKKLEDIIAHDISPSTQIGYGIVVGAHRDYDTTDVEIINCTVYNVPRTGIAIYEEYGGDYSSQISTVLIRGCTVYNAGEYTGNSDGIMVKNDVVGATIELCHLYNNAGRGFQFVNDGGTPSPSGCIFRYNILNGNDKGGIHIAANGNKDIEIYGNIIYQNNNGSGWGGSGVFLETTYLSGTISVKIYNNTFFENANGEILIGSNPATYSALEIKNNALYSLSSKTPLYDTDGDITAHNNNSFEDGGSGNVVYTNGSTYTEGTVIGSYEATAQVGDPSFKDTANLPTGFSGTFGTDMEPNNDGLSATIGDLIENGADLGADSSIDQYGIAGSPARAGTWDIGAYEYVAP